MEMWRWALTQQSRYRLEDVFPLMRYVNLARREDRRTGVECQFAKQGMAVERMPAVNGQWVRNLRGHLGPGQYGCSLSHRMILRGAEQQKAGAVLIFEDDVVLHPSFRRLAEALALPEDWEVFYFGCQHRLEPVPVSPGVVRVTKALSTHAFTVRGSSLRLVREALDMADAEGKRRECDSLLADLHARIPVYAAFPNLAWQSANHSDIRNQVIRSYRDEDGEQSWNRSVLENPRRQMAEMIRPFTDAPLL